MPGEHMMKYEKSNYGSHSIVDSSQVLTCGETGRVIAVFYNDYDLDEVLLKLNESSKSQKTIPVPFGINLDAWEEWSLFRKQSKKKITPAAAKKQFKLLLKYSLDDQQKIIDKSISSDYRGLFDLKESRHERHQPTNQPRSSAVSRVRAAGERQLAEIEAQEAQLAAMGSANRDIRPPDSVTVRRTDARELGEAIEGHYTRSD